MDLGEFWRFLQLNWFSKAKFAVGVIRPWNRLVVAGFKLSRMFSRSGVHPQIWTSSLPWLGSTSLQRGCRGGKVGARNRQGAAAVGYREARARRGGVRGIALVDSRPPTRPQTDMSDISGYGRLCCTVELSALLYSPKVWPEQIIDHHTGSAEYYDAAGRKS